MLPTHRGLPSTYHPAALAALTLHFSTDLEPIIAERLDELRSLINASFDAARAVEAQLAPGDGQAYIEQFASYLGKRVSAAASRKLRAPAPDAAAEPANHSLERALALLKRMRLDDLYLAFRCIDELERQSKLTPAISRFQGKILNIAVAGLRIRPALREDTGNQTWLRLCRRNGRGRLGLEQYDGLCSLLNFTRRAAYWSFLELLQPAQQDGLEGPEAGDSTNGMTSPESRLGQMEMADLIKGAFEQVLTTMRAQEVLLLAQYFVDGLTHEEMARMRGVDRANVTKPLGAARLKLARRVWSLLLAGPFHEQEDKRQELHKIYRRLMKRNFAQTLGEILERHRSMRG